MAVNLNLLPPELTVSKSLSKVLKTTRALGVISIAGFLIFVVIIGALFVISNINIRNLRSKNDSLQTQIKNQESSEQQLILIKDRIKKIQSLQNIPNSAKNLADIEPVLSAIAGSSSINEFNTVQDKTGITLSFKSASDITAFMKSLSSSSAFKTIVMSSFGFSPTSGYTVSFDLVKK